MIRIADARCAVVFAFAAMPAVASDFVFFAGFESSLHPVTGAVIFTESMPDPSLVADNVGEWIELANLSEQTVDLGGCTVGNGSTTNTLPNFDLAPGAYAVIARSNDANGNGGVAAFATFTFSLTSNGTLFLDCDAREIDHAPWVSGIAGQSFNLYPDKTTAQDNDVVESWCFYVATTYNGTDSGTPGTANGTCPSG